MKLNKFHLLGLVLLVIITGSLLSGFVFSLGNKEGVQSLNQGNQEFICKALPKKPPSARDVEVGYYANSNNMKPQEQVHPGLLPVNKKEGFFGSMSRFFSPSIIEGNDASGNAVDASGATTDAAGDAAGAADEAAKKLEECHKQWQNDAIALENYNKGNVGIKAQMESQFGCKPPVASADPNTTTTAGASSTDGPQWKCVQVGQDNNVINEERVDEKGVEGKMRGVPPGDEDLYMLKTKIVPPVCPKCPECPCAKCPVCGDDSKTTDDKVEDDMEKNNIQENGDAETNNRLNNREPEQGQASRARANRVIRNLGDQSNGNFLQPPGGTNNAINNLTGGGGSNNNYYTSKARNFLAPRGGSSSGGFNLGAYSRGLTGPLPRLNSFSSFSQ
tara:strand:- start:2369 stop:3535 length:1167 start_codon:yes stop_codon:yes gene_type:complete